MRAIEHHARARGHPGDPRQASSGWLALPLGEQLLESLVGQPEELGGVAQGQIAVLDKEERCVIGGRR
jgi:hypothetical protein